MSRCKYQVECPIQSVLFILHTRGCSHFDHHFQKYLSVFKGNSILIKCLSLIINL